MRLPLIMMIAVILISIGIDWLICRYLSRIKFVIYRRIHAAIAVTLYVIMAIVIVFVVMKIDNDELFRYLMWALYVYFAAYISKAVIAVSILISKLLQRWTVYRLLPIIGCVIGCVAFVLMMWGTVNRFRYQVVEQTIAFENLPEGFDGYRIAQISDLHVGSYNDTTYVSKIANVINALDADVIVFTGDIVNRRSDELYPFVAPLSRLKARDGVFSILGNHDYGDYSSWDSDLAKKANMQLMYDLQHKMGWRLLLNETAILHKGKDSIALIGVENVGDPPFKVYGDLRKAYPTLSDSLFKVLLTHNPAHWTHDIADSDTMNVDLSLSGHTHAMQIELDVAGHRYSPSVFRYETWGGLYEDKSGRRKLYVNIGLGTVAIPARIGATPEITLITLRKAK